MVVGETGVSNNETTTVCTPAGALFAAGDVLSWLAAGAQSVDWWDMNNYGNTGRYLHQPGLRDVHLGLAARAGDALLRLRAGLGAGQAGRAAGARWAPLIRPTCWPTSPCLPGGQEAVAFLNTNTSSAQTVTFRPGVPLSGQLQTWTYSAGNQNATDSNIVQGTASASSLAHGITLPAESMVILESQGQ